MSNKQNILFRANSSSSIGTGHIISDLVLASKYKNLNVKLLSFHDIYDNIIITYGVRQ